MLKGISVQGRAKTEHCGQHLYLPNAERISVPLNCTFQ